MVFDVDLLLVLLLTTPSAFAVPGKDNCDIHALVGHSLKLPLDHMAAGVVNALRWAHNTTVIFYSQSGRLRLGKPTDVDEHGSLLLQRLTFSSAGEYRGDLINTTGTRINGWRGRVCVVAPVAKPDVTFVCGSGGATATLSCNVPGPRDVDFVWTHGGLLLKGETKPTLSVSLAKVKGDKDFSCGVSNVASRAQSNAVRLKCEPPPPVTYCFKASTIMAAVAGGSGVLLLLLVINAVTCYRQKKEPRHQGDLVPMVRTAKVCKTDSVTPDYETMHPGVSPKPSPRPSPALYGRDDFRSEDYLTTSEAKPGPSPVPKPRTMAPQAANQ